MADLHEYPNQAAGKPLQHADRYSRQVLFEHLGRKGQEKLSAARVTLIGCGALGTALADTLIRAGVGFLRIVDRDYVELNNLQRQVLFTEADVAEGIPKAVAAANRLAAINSTVNVEPIVADAVPSNIESFVESTHLLLDGTDNFEIRFLMNDVAVKRRIPWVYGACVGADGMVMPILPGETPCLRCVWDRPPPPGISPTCDTAGILAATVHIVAALQSVEALKILTGQPDALNRKLVQVDVWTGRFEQFNTQSAYDKGDCPCCKHGKYEFLDAGDTNRTALLCGRDAVQVSPGSGKIVDFEQIAARITPVAKAPPQFNRYLLRFEVEGCQVSLFPDGRAIIKGVSELERGRSLYARYIGT